MASAENYSVRFNGRVRSYQRARPDYPKEIVSALAHACGLTPDSSIVDVAAGTGIFSRLFLEHGNTVTAVEPNAEMRAACSELQAHFPRLTVVAGNAEHTGLPDGSADFVTAAQAMHWFDLGAARKEFSRILRKDGWCVVAYNERRRSGNAFLDGYEALLRRFGTDYEVIQQRHLEQDDLRNFFQPSRIDQLSFTNAQWLDHDALVERFLSSSYMPQADHPDHAAMRAAIATLFEQNEDNGTVRLEYECILSYGHLT